MNFYPLVVSFVKEAFERAGKERNIPHCERTVHWVTTLDPACSEALRIAAYAHDCERAFRDLKAKGAAERSKGFLDEVFLRNHQMRGARIVGDFLRAQHADDALIRHAEALIACHEIGGTHEADILRDADSVSFFETQAPYFLSHLLSEVGAGKIRDKFAWMFERITHPEARRVAKPMFEEVMKSLERRI